MLTNFRYLNVPRETVAGHKIVAYFDVPIGELTVCDIALVRFARGTMGVWAPSSTRRSEPAVIFAHRLRDELTAEAELIWRHMLPSKEAA